MTQDLRFTLRQLGKNPGFTSTAILMLALGMCASVAIFAFVDAALIRPLPYRDPARLIGVYETIPQCKYCNLSYLDYLDWKKSNTTLSSLEAYHSNGFILTTPSGVEPANAAQVSAGFFRTLGVSPALGRDFHAGEDLAGAAHTVMLSNGVWRDRYGEKPDVVGRTVTLDGEPYLIIGVLPRDFHFAPVGAADYWTPLNPNGSCEKRRSCHNLYGIARLRDGVAIQTALADTTRIAKLLERQYPDSNHGQGAEVAPLADVIVGDIRPILLTLLGGAGLLLLIACVNVASLLLVRSESRRREMAVRSALGASRLRLMRQFLTEGLVLVAAATALGLASAAWTMKLMTRLIPIAMQQGMPFLRELSLNHRVSAFACAVSIVAVIVFAIAPTLRLPFGEIQEGLVQGGRGSAGLTWRRLGSKLVVVELATAMVLLVGAGLFGQSLYRLLHVDLGFKPDHLATMAVEAPNARYAKEAQEVALVRQMLSRVSTLPGVKSAATASTMPVSFNGNTTWIRFVGRPFHGEHNEVNERDVSSEYFTTIGAKLLRGRYFTDAEDASKPGVVIINQALARKYFAGEDPVGKQMGDTSLTPQSLRQIVGIVDDIREGGLDNDIWPAVYIPYNQSPDTYFNLLVRTSQAEDPVLPVLSSTIHQIDRGIVTMDSISMSKRIANSYSAYLHRSSAWLVGGFAGLALLLGVVGLYGTVAYSVGQRTREIGVRMALGADPGSIHAMVLKEAGGLTAFGVLAGVACSLATTALIRKLLFGVRSWDVSTLLAVAAVLAICSLLASYIPARRAARINPVEALRAE